jgi:glucans biosynthesis protein C
MRSGSGAVHLSFGQYWMEYLKGVGTFYVGPWTGDRTNQMHFWFLSLLLTFFMVFALVYVLVNRVGRPSHSLPVRRAPSPRSILRVLLIAGALASLGYFAVSLVVSEMSWFTVDLLWQFQPGGLIFYIACIALGALASSQRWFEGDGFPRRLAVWGLVCLFLVAGFFVVGREIFAHPTTSHFLATGLLLAFSLVRAFLCLSILVLLIAYARGYWNRPARLNQKLAANSYNIHLVHIFFVTFLQEVLMVWRGGPALAKEGIVFVAVLPISYGISRFIDRFPRGFILAFAVLFVVVLLLAR